MTNIVILGAGVMGSALAVTAASHPGNEVTLVGSPLDDHITQSINDTRLHPTLNVNIAEDISCIAERDLSSTLMQCADIVVIGVSSPGVPWAVGRITESVIKLRCIALVTKGLVASDTPGAPPLTYADALTRSIDTDILLGIGGPCIARELALGLPTFVTFSARSIKLATEIRDHFQTDTYRVAVHPDFVGLEACAALKNFYCIGVSAMLGAWQIEEQTAKNPVAALFNQAVIEMDIVSAWIKAATDTDTARLNRAGWNNVAFDLPGMGDLHVTVGGGRNSRLGTLLGQGLTLNEIVEGPMKGVTVEGLDTGRQLIPGFESALGSGALPKAQLPLTCAILDSIKNDSAFFYDFASHQSRD